MIPMNAKQIERWSPWLLMTITLLLWQLMCSAFDVSEFVFPSPLRIGEQFIEFRGVIAAHAWRTFWVTMVGFGLAIVVGVLLGLCQCATGGGKFGVGINRWEKSWIKEIVSSAKNESNKYRGTLIICETIEHAQIIAQKIEKESLS